MRLAQIHQTVHCVYKTENVFLLGPYLLVWVFVQFKFVYASGVPNGQQLLLRLGLGLTAEWGTVPAVTPIPTHPPILTCSRSHFVHPSLLILHLLGSLGFGEQV